jgi:hypothetical protein
MVYFLPYIIRVTKSKMLRWPDLTTAWRILVLKPRGEGLFGKPANRYTNGKMDYYGS